MSAPHLSGSPLEPQRATALTGASLATLRRIVAGEVLTASRRFPYPFRYSLGPLDTPNDSDAKGITPSHAQTLIHEALVVARHPSPLDDFIVYDLTEKGRRVAAEGLPPMDPTQLDAFPDIPRQKKRRAKSARELKHD